MKNIRKGKSNKNIRQRNYFSFIVLIIGFILGAVFIIIGVRNNLNADYDMFEAKTEDEAKAVVEERNNHVKDLRKQLDEEYERSAYSEKYDDISNEIIIAEGDLHDAEAELSSVRNGFYEKMKSDKIWSSVPLIVLGAAMIVVGIGLFMRLNSSPRRKNVILTITEEDE